MTASERLSAHVTTITPDALPASGLAEMRRLLLDYLGVALSGSGTDSGRITAGTLTALGGTPQATVIGFGSKIPALHAAFANAVSEHSIELDDVDDAALFHYGPPVVSAALAVAQWQGAYLDELLVAMLLGCEVTNRLSLAMNPALRDRGFHTTPTCGVFGATAAAARLMHLSTGQLTSAFGLAGAQASGLMEMYGPSMQKRVNPGPAARNGVMAAMLAANGYTGTDLILEGQRGFGAAFAGGIDLNVLLDGLGVTVPVIVEYKPYSAARPIHNAIDAVLQFRQLGIGVADIEGLVVYRHPTWSEYHRNPSPSTYHEAQVSLPFATAVAFVDGAALPAQFSPEQLARPDLRELLDKISIETDLTLPRGVSCRLELTLRDGSTKVAQVDYPKGSARNPLTDLDLEDKFYTLASTKLHHGRAHEIVERIRDVNQHVDVDGLVELCNPTKDAPNAA